MYTDAHRLVKDLVLANKLQLYRTILVHYLKLEISPRIWSLSSFVAQSVVGSKAPVVLEDYQVDKGTAVQAKAAQICHKHDYNSTEIT